ncbi:MAG: ATP-binding protein [Cellvibrio sp.]|uniref:ATP-binding protein n=1 Tax=Cellvibrio sp. TaxID=1965322 RepID=UPI0031A125C2
MIQYLITAIIDIAVGILAFSKKENPAAKALAFTVFSLGIWSLELYLLTVVKNIDALNIWFHITRWGMFFIPATFAFLTWRLVGSRSQRFKKFVVIPSLFVSVGLSIANAFIFPSTLKEVDGGYLPAIDSFYYVFLVNFVWSFGGAIGLVLTSYKTSPYREKQRLKWLFITLCASFIGGGLGLYSMPSEFYLSRFVGSITNIVFVALLFYSTIQHNLMDFRFALSVGLSKAILLGFFVWLYFVVTSVVGEHTDSNGSIFVLLLFVAIILESYPRLLKWILPNAKKILVKNGYDFDQVKIETENELRNSINFSTMIEVLDHLLLKTLKLNNYKVLMVQHENDHSSEENNYDQNGLTLKRIAEKNQLVEYCAQQTQLIMADEMPSELQHEMEKCNAILCFPVFYENKVLGIVLVGSPTNVSYYRYDDLKIFEWLKSELGQVLNRLIRLNNMHDQLGEAKKTLSMLSLMSHYHHDIKAPFAIIDGVLSNDIYDREKQRDIVLSQVERGSKLIATMAGILGGNHKRRIQSCALETLVQDCLYLFEASFDKIEYELGGIPKIKGDAEDLKILLINLIKNAAEARQQGEDLTVKVRSWLEDGNVYFSIADNGVGMTEKQLTNLWEPGFSVKNFGNGIGMQAIKRIVDEHNARIDVRSEPYKGSNFTLCFFATQIIQEDENTDATKDELAERRAAYTAEKRSSL